MKSILILAPVSDSHANVVGRELVKRGAKVHRMSGTDFPVNRSVSLSFEDAVTSTHFKQSGHHINPEDYAVIWRRRGEYPVIDKNNIHPDEQTFAKAEALDAALGWREVSAASNTRWINPTGAAIKASNKPYQLLQAQKSGLTVPVTLISNDPDDIYDFYKRHTQRIIYKPLTPGAFRGDGELMATFVERVEAPFFDEPDVIALAPGIYQAYVEKAYELRVNIFGSNIVTTKINNQHDADTAVDWRQHVHKTKLEPYQLPKEIEARLHGFMARMGLVFGAVDVLKDVDGNYIFLEVNEMGQFLWIDQMLPVSNLLGHMCSFIEEIVN